ncbi:MAG: hypothetical protein K5890_00855 [Bacteroidales bacterium]|nr:hypothetical protein [Bacteroidales bacterium]
MKKCIVFCFCFAALALFSTCTKDQDGVYNPSKKIHKIYYLKEDVQELQEVWNWNGNLLSSIDYYLDGVVYYTNSFYYDNDRLTTIQNETSYATFNYDGDKIDGIKIFRNGVEDPSTIYSFEYKGNKLSTLKIILKENLISPDKKNLVNPLKYILPQFCNDIEKVVVKCMDETTGKYQTETITLNLTWSGGNITQVKTSVVEGSYTMQEETKCTYDNKENPVKGFLGVYTGGVADNFHCNKNNVLTSNTLEGIYTYTVTNSYEYESNYPVKKNSIVHSSSQYVDDYSETIIYEYE